MKLYVKKQYIFLLFSSVILFFTSCVSVKKINSLSPVYVTNSKTINLLPPYCIDENLDSMQLLTGSFGSNSFSLMAYIQADENGIFMSLLNDFGTDMGTLTYDGYEAVIDSPVFPSNLKPEYILCDFQYAFYSSQAVKQNLNASKLDFSVEENAGTEIRKVKNGKKVIEVIEKQPGSVKIQNLLRGYEYKLLEGEE